jgi:hypothetical protein
MRTLLAIFDMMDGMDTGSGFEFKVTLRSLHDSSGDREYWQARTPAERLEAMTILRRQYFESRQEPEPDFQRVLRIVDRGKS